LIDNHPGFAVFWMLLCWVRILLYPALIDRCGNILAEGLLTGERPRWIVRPQSALQIPKRQSVANREFVEELTKGPRPRSSGSLATSLHGSQLISAAVGASTDCSQFCNCPKHPRLPEFHGLLQGVSAAGADVALRGAPARPRSSDPRRRRWASKPACAGEPPNSSHNPTATPSCFKPLLHAQPDTPKPLTARLTLRPEAVTCQQQPFITFHRRRHLLSPRFLKGHPRPFIGFHR
jgi:hypothetical protein